MKKLCNLPPQKFTALEDFMDFLLTRREARLLVYTATKLSETGFAKTWDNSEDAESELSLQKPSIFSD